MSIQDNEFSNGWLKQLKLVTTAEKNKRLPLRTWSWRCFRSRNTIHPYFQEASCFWVFECQSIRINLAQELDKPTGFYNQKSRCGLETPTNSSTCSGSNFHIRSLKKTKKKVQQKGVISSVSIWILLWNVENVEMSSSLLLKEGIPIARISHHFSFRRLWRFLFWRGTSYSFEVKRLSLEKPNQTVDPMICSRDLAEGFKQYIDRVH